MLRKQKSNMNNKEIFAEYPDVVTPDDLQTMLKIGRSSAYDLLKNKLIKSIRVGKKYIIPKENVIDFLKTAT